MTTKQIHSLPTKDLYARWAKVYDTDGNILQAIDDHSLPPLLTRALNLLPTTQSLTITELGAGTGRNTLKLLSLPNISTIHALDLSPEMLAVAQSRCSPSANKNIDLQFLEFDALQPQDFPQVKEIEGKADMVLSTLVLEHLPIQVFFETAKRLLKPGGILVLSNMHAEMGKRSQAGFVGEQGEKVQGDSFVYEIGEVVDVAGGMGFEVLGEVQERSVERADLEGGVVGERGRKWVGCRVWFGCVLRLRE